MGRIVVVGGGITGLSAAEHITRIAPDAHVTLLEASRRLGGHIRSERHDGFVMEAGPDVILTMKPAAAELATRVGIGGRLQGVNSAAKGSFISSGGRLRRIPDGLTGLVPSRLAPFLTTRVISPLGKLRVALEPLVRVRADDADESIEGFVTRRLGREMYHKLVEPLLSGISAGDGARLSITAMFPQLWALEREHGGLLRGTLRKRRAERERAASPATPVARGAPGGFVSFPGGLEELVTAAERTLMDRSAATGHVTLRTGVGVLSVDMADSESDSRFVLSLTSGDNLEADAVVLATPAYASSAMLATIAPELAKQLGAIEYASTATISLAYSSSDVRRRLDATGYVVPRRERRAVLACTWTSAKFCGRSPKGHALFRLFVGGAGRGGEELLPDDALLRIAGNEMREVMGISAPPLLYRINRFDRALPQYTVGHVDRMKAIADAASRIPGVELAGAVYRGVGIPDCVQSGSDAASRALRFVSSLPLPNLS
jgi:protoporphyrinogen/coproporphyrinogen III oxidase